MVKKKNTNGSKPQTPAKSTKSARKMTSGNGGLRMEESIPAAYSVGRRRKAPVYAMSGNGNMSVSHCEYLGELEASANPAENSFQFALNPGLLESFPWLSGIATRFESYRFKSLKVVYDPSTATSTSGLVAMGIDYDAGDPPPTTVTQLLQYKDANKAAAYRPFSVSTELVDRATLSTQKYIRYGAVTGDIKTYDLGNLYVLLAGISTEGIIGSLWLEYVVDLITPQLNVDALVLANSAKLVSGGTESPTAPFGTSLTVTGGLPVALKSDLINSLTGITTGRVGSFLMEYEADGTVLVPGVTPALHVLTPSGLEDMSGVFGSILSADWIVNTAATAATLVVLFALNDPLAGISMDFGSSATTLVNSLARLSPYAKILG